MGGSTSGGDLTEHDVREGVGRVERQAISDMVTVDKSVVSNLVSLLETSANAGMLVHVFMLNLLRVLLKIDGIEFLSINYRGGSRRFRGASAELYRPRTHQS